MIVQSWHAESFSVVPIFTLKLANSIHKLIDKIQRVRVLTGSIKISLLHSLVSSALCLYFIFMSDFWGETIIIGPDKTVKGLLLLRLRIVLELTNGTTHIICKGIYPNLNTPIMIIIIIIISHKRHTKSTTTLLNIIYWIENFLTLYSCHSGK